MGLITKVISKTSYRLKCQLAGLASENIVNYSMVDLEPFKYVKAVIADWDDTTISTFPSVVKIVDNFADILGVERPGETGLLQFWGQPVEEVIYKLFGKHNQSLSSPPDNCRYPILGVEQAVLKLSEMRFLQGIISSGPREGIIRDIRTYYPTLSSVYTFICGTENTLIRKPNPKVFDTAFNESLYPRDINEKQTVYIGDFYGDFDAATARGLLFLGIANNNKARNWFIERGLEEDLIFSSFTLIPDFFESVQNK